MGRVIATLPDDLEDKFRRLAMEKFGMKRGYLKKGFNDAIREWVKKQEEKEKKEVDIVE